MRTFDDLPHDRTKPGVVDGVGEVVGFRRFVDVALHLEIDLELLSVLALTCTRTVPALERHAAELNPIHQRNCAKSRTPRLSHVIDASVQVRPGREADLEALNDLYNHYVVEAHYTFDLEPHDMEWRREWFTHYAETGPHRLFVALEAKRLIGFATSSKFRPKPGYDTSVETSVYVAPDATGKGAGSRLYAELFRALEGEDLHRAYAGITLPNTASVALHERFGFKRVAHFTEQGRKFGRYWDVAWFEKPLGGAV